MQKKSEHRTTSRKALTFYLHHSPKRKNTDFVPIIIEHEIASEVRRYTSVNKNSNPKLVINLTILIPSRVVNQSKINESNRVVNRSQINETTC